MDIAEGISLACVKCIGARSKLLATIHTNPQLPIPKRKELYQQVFALDDVIRTLTAFEYEWTSGGGA